MPYLHGPGRRQPRGAGLDGDRPTNDAAYFVQYLSNPAQFGNTVMGSYSYLGQENLEAPGAFLAASDGTQGDG